MKIINVMWILGLFMKFPEDRERVNRESIPPIDLLLGLFSTQDRDKMNENKGYEWKITSRYTI